MHIARETHGDALHPTGVAAAQPELLSSWSRSSAPLITLAVPHYRHRRYLEVVLQSIFEQTSDDLEVLVSDDCSPDDSNASIPPLLQRSGRAFRYYAHRNNLGYDGNVRFCLGAAQGRYVMLLGNDDALAMPSAVHDLLGSLQELEWPEVAVTNYRQWADESAAVKRVFSSGILGSGPEVAIANFRIFSFVSGLIYAADAARAHETDRWDKSIFYQIYIACRIMAAGGRLAGIDQVTVAKDVLIDGSGVPNYITKHGGQRWSFAKRDGGLPSVIRVTVDAVVPYVPPAKRSATISAVIRQVLNTSYPFWLIEYRRVANWAFAVGMARALLPYRVLAEYQVSAVERGKVWLTYFGVTILGLIAPIGLATRLKTSVARAVRLRKQRRT